MKKPHSTATAVALLSGIHPTALAQIEEITVTATKREENAQDIPVAVKALVSESLDQQDIDVFSDYLLALPGVNAGATGPGQNTIYIRGVASTTPSLSVAGVGGIAPNVALYLDEQPVTQVGRNLDVYAVDLQRIEVLPGPQGTLFGASAQAGTVRLITNKPDYEDFSASVTAGISYTENGEPSNKLEAVINAPLSENVAIRGVAYADDQGGYIDNVPGTLSLADSGRFRPATFVRPNGVAVGTASDGNQSTTQIEDTVAGSVAAGVIPEALAPFVIASLSDFSGVTFVEGNNATLVQDDFNDTQYLGFRFGIDWQISESWNVYINHSQQQIESDGVFFIDPSIDDGDELSVSRFRAEELDDEYSSTSLTLEGRIGALEIIYTTAFLDRETNQDADFTDYFFVGNYLPYYLCDPTVTYPTYFTAPGALPTPVGTCQPPTSGIDSLTSTATFTNELRATTPRDKRVYGTAGVFFSDQELEERNDFIYAGSPLVSGRGPFAAGNSTGGGFAVNFPAPGAVSTDPGPFPTGVIFRNDFTREDQTLGVFGEVTFEVVPETLAITAGLRYYDIRFSLDGSANGSFFNLGVDADNNLGTALSTNRSANTFTVTAGGVPNVFPIDDIDGVISKANISWTPSNDLLFYFTYSEGFRPPLLNRPAGAGGGIVPASVDTDEVTNFEFGWKSTLLDNQLQFNGSVFLVDIDDLQTTIFDPGISNLFFSDNAANAQVRGVEGDFIWAPESILGLTVGGAFSILDTEIEEILTQTTAIAPVGSELSFAPDFQANVRVRYEWQPGSESTFYVQPQLTYSAESFSDIVAINRAVQDSYTILDFSAGYAKGNWQVDLFASNLTDERAALFTNFENDNNRVTINRPRTVGLRATIEF